MMRTLSLGVVLTIVGSACGEESPARPIGRWTRTVEDGSTWTLAVEQERLAFIAAMPGNQTVRITVPKYDISDEGILFGYARQVVWSRGEESAEQKGLFPFALRLRMDGQTITISDFTMRNIDAKGAAGLMGVYDRQPDRNADASGAPAGGLSR